jgi:hypothetical protein
MTAKELAAARYDSRKREAKGADVSQHNGARPLVHRSAKDKARADRRSWRRELDGR